MVLDIRFERMTYRLPFDSLGFSPIKSTIRITTVVVILVALPATEKAIALPLC